MSVGRYALCLRGFLLFSFFRAFPNKQRDADSDDQSDDPADPYGTRGKDRSHRRCTCSCIALKVYIDTLVGVIVAKISTGKIPPGMFLMTLLRRILSRFEQLSKSKVPIELMLFGRVVSTSPEQPLKALLPILTTLSGMLLKIIQILL